MFSNLRTAVNVPIVYHRDLSIFFFLHDHSFNSVMCIFFMSCIQCTLELYLVASLFLC